MSKSYEHRYLSGKTSSFTSATFHPREFLSPKSLGKRLLSDLVKGISEPTAGGLQPAGGTSRWNHPNSGVEMRGGLDGFTQLHSMDSHSWMWKTTGLVEEHGYPKGPVSTFDYFTECKSSKLSGRFRRFSSEDTASEASDSPS